MTTFQAIERELDALPEYENPPFSAIGLDELMSRQFPPKEMLLGPWLPFQGVAMVFGPRGTGKTHFALGVAYAVASGGNYLHWQAPRPRKVLVIDGEMQAATLKERWIGIVANNEKEPPPGDYIRILADSLSDSGLPDLSTEKGQEAIQPHIHDAELIIVDNLSTLARSGRENESESWGVIQGWALKQRREGRSVLFVHHAGKGGEQRGTSKREDIMDSVIKLSLPSDYSPVDGARFVVTFTKSRGFSGPEAEPFEAALRDGLWSMKSLEDVRIAQIIELHSEGLNQRDIASEVGCSAATVNRAIKRHKAGG